VPFSKLASDLKSVTTTPNYAFITPNLCNDMHNCSITQGNNWLAANVPTILNSKAFTTQNSLLIITWDEGEETSNHIPTILIGSNIKKNYHASSTQYNHYALLHTIEQAWGLPTLTSNDAKAPLMNEFFISK
jgi:acid phosphatase